MKILLVAPMPPQAQAAGAIPLVLHAQLTGLLQRHSVTLVTVAGPDPAEWAALDRLQAAGVDVQAIRRVEPVGIDRWQRRWQLARGWLSGRYPWRTLWFWEPGIQQILDRLLGVEHFDLVQVEDNAMGIYRYRTNVPIIFTEYEVRRPRPINWRGWTAGREWALQEADWRRWYPYQRNVWRNFDRVQVFTLRDAELVRSIAPEIVDRVRVNPFSVALPTQLDGDREEAGRILFVGNFTHPPNVDAALWLGREIMPLLRNRAPNVRLTIVGIYPPQSVQQLACDDIAVTGYVPEIEPFLASAAIVIAPLRIGNGQRMKVLHSMALGKAVVTTRRGAEGLDVNECSPRLVIADDAESIADATATLLASRAARSELGSRARAFVAEHHSPEAYVRRLELIYSEL